METRRNARVVNIHEAKTTLSRLIERVLLGEEIMIAKNNIPIVKLVPLDAAPPPRVLGALAGKIHLALDFDADLGIADEFAGGAEDPLRAAAYPRIAPRDLAVAEGIATPRKRRP